MAQTRFSSKPLFKKWGILIVLVIVGALLRIHVAQTVPEEVDENNYLASAVDFRRAVDRGDWSALTDDSHNFEHPPLAKLLYAVTVDHTELDALPEDFGGDFLDGMPNSLDRARWQAIMWGLIAVIALTLIHPMAGLVMAVQAMLVYYTGIAYLDALPMMFTALMAWQYVEDKGKGSIHFWLSAVFLGGAAAGKYPFALGGVVILLHMLYLRQYRWRDLAVWGGLALLVFFILNPYIWTDPLGRLHEQLTFHQNYAGRRNYSPIVPWRQFLFPRQDIRYDDGLLLLPIIDMVIFGLAVPGGFLLLGRKSVFGWWLLIGIVFLMFWRAQWIQHNMIIAVPYCMAVAESCRWVFNRMGEAERISNE
jgi:hypothetical protein